MWKNSLDYVSPRDSAFGFPTGNFLINCSLFHHRTARHSRPTGHWLSQSLGESTLRRGMYNLPAVPFLFFIPIEIHKREDFRFQFATLFFFYFFFLFFIFFIFNLILILIFIFFIFYCVVFRFRSDSTWNVPSFRSGFSAVRPTSAFCSPW